ncbi:unnamed protein product [Brassica oleracea var. botrytis]
MSIVFSRFILFFTITTSFLTAVKTWAASPALLHPDELKALEEIASTLGITKLNLGYGDPCELKNLKIDVAQDPGSENSIACDCSVNNTCHITRLTLKTLSLPGKLPPELVKLPYFQEIDLCRNCLSGSIPIEWASMPYLTLIAVCANNLSGPLPTGLQNFKNLKVLGVEANQFSGPIPDEIGNLTTLKRLNLASNQFTGSLPTTLAKLVNLQDFRISDNKFNGIIPSFIGDWPWLKKLHLYASGLKGPIPDALTRLENLTDMRISDMTGISSFPYISSKSMETLVLRNLSLSGQIPSYIWSMPVLKTLDLSFKKLSGEVQSLEKAPQHTYLNENMLSGNIGSGAFLNNESYIDLSYNNFSYPSGCPDKSNINTYRSSYLQKNLTGLLPCAGPIKCSYQRSLHINCGGDNVVITNYSHKITYQADNSETKAATNQHHENWGVSSTGYLAKDKYFITPTFTLSEDFPSFYKSARQSAHSLVYYAFCMESGAYNVKLHFMEIQFSDEEPYSLLGRRIFDIYGELFLWDFNIKEEANGTRKPIVKEANVNVTNHLLEIRLYWAGKGTTQIPARGNYGPIISAISLCHSSLGPGCEAVKTKHHTSYPLVFGITGALLAITLLALGLYAQKRCRGDRNTRKRGNSKLLQTILMKPTNLEKEVSDRYSNGYMAPEYALYGQLTEKADVFSFGVVAMEIVSGKSNMKQTESSDHIWLINWALTLQQTGDIMDIIDPVLEGEFNRKEAEMMIKVALVCTNSSPLSRPTMSEAVQMLEGETKITQVLSDPGLYGNDWNISKLRGTDTHGSSSTSGLTDQTATTTKSSVSGADLYPLYPESMILNSTVDFSSPSL